MSKPPSLERHLELVPEATPRPRRVHVIRVSNQADDAKSPEEQKARLADADARDGAECVATFYEPSVSGQKTPLVKRPGLLPAIELVETGEADEIVVAYFDRLVRNLTIQREILERVERAGGRVLTLDFGEIRQGTALEVLSSTLIGAVLEYVAHSASERSQDSKVNAALRGVPPFPSIPPGYRKVGEGDARRIVVDEAEAELMREAFRMRAAGKSFADIRDYLAAHGIDRTTAAVRKLLRSRWYLGELRWGKIVNPGSHDAIIDLALFREVQETTGTAGRKSKVPQLLARLGVLRCATCGSRMSYSTGSSYPYYSCRERDCTAHAGISAHIAERVVWQATLDELERERVAGHASSEDKVAAVEAELAKATEAFRSAVRVFDGMDDEAETRERLLELRQRRDELTAKRDKLLASSTRRRTLPPADASLEARRKLVRTTIAGAFVSPGRGDCRVRLELLVDE
jgi:DNA invertase Pin-like site-specific DNA recombinase